jgi:hypothetical protein
MSCYILRYINRTNLDHILQGTDPKLNLQIPKMGITREIWGHGAPENFENQVSQTPSWKFFLGTQKIIVMVRYVFHPCRG